MSLNVQDWCYSSGGRAVRTAFCARSSHKKRTKDKTARQRRSVSVLALQYHREFLGITYSEKSKILRCGTCGVLVLAARERPHRRAGDRFVWGNIGDFRRCQLLLSILALRASKDTIVWSFECAVAHTAAASTLTPGGIPGFLRCAGADSSTRITVRKDFSYMKDGRNVRNPHCLGRIVLFVGLMSHSSTRFETATDVGLFYAYSHGYAATIILTHMTHSICIMPGQNGLLVVLCGVSLRHDIHNATDTSAHLYSLIYTQ